MTMKIIVLATGPFAVPALRWLLASQHEVVMVVTRPVDDPGKRRKTAANPVRELAETVSDLSVFAPANVNDPDAVERLRERHADLLFVCDYGQILRRPTLAATRLGGINLHGSLLPAWRGAAPVQWAVYHGETVTGVTVIQMTPRLDSGPVLVRKRLAIAPGETAEQLEPRLAELGVAAVEEAISRLQTWDGQSLPGEPQDPHAATQAPRLHKSHGRIDWNRPAIQLVNQVRAFQPWPGSYTHWLPEAGRPLRLILHRVSAADDDGQPAGRVVAVGDEGIRVATGQGCLVIHELQPAGKKRMPAAVFLRGRAIRAGDRLGDPE
jgi:methionyl-tRNA formyltransferase